MKLTFHHRAWCVPSEDRAFEGEQVVAAVVRERTVDGHIANESHGMVAGSLESCAQIYQQRVAVGCVGRSAKSACDLERRIECAGLRKSNRATRSPRTSTAHRTGGVHAISKKYRRRLRTHRKKIGWQLEHQSAVGKQCSQCLCEKNIFKLARRCYGWTGSASGDDSRWFSVGGLS